MAITSTPTLRKAALLIRSLDADSAAVLLSQLSASEAKAVRAAIRELGEVDPDEQEQLREAFRPASESAQTAPDEAGVELALSTDVPPETPSEPMRPAVVATPPAPPAVDQPFAWLEGGDLPSLAAMLEREHLSTVAVVLSHLPADRASEVLSALPPNRRAAALERLADLGESDRASLEVIEHELADWIAAQKAERQRRADRLRSIQAILGHSSPGTCELVLAEITAHDASLAMEIGSVRSIGTNQTPAAPKRLVGAQAARLQKPMPVARTKPSATSLPDRQKPYEPPLPSFEFERLVELNERQLTELFRNCPSERVVMALAGASERITRHVEKRLPKNVAKELRRRMLALSSVRLSDLAAAQDEIARVAGRLFGRVADSRDVTVTA